MERISKFQLSAMIILFQIGSSTLFELGIGAKQDAWLTVLTGMAVSFLLLMLFLGIQRREPNKSLVQILVQYLGFFGKIAAFSYVLFFAYESMRNVRDFGDLIIMSFLSRTPISLIMLIMVLLSSYAIFKGIEVFFRLSEFMLPGVLLFYSLLIIMFISSGIVHLDHLLPILENGIMSVLKVAIKETSFFPFGQMVIFLMYWHYLADKGIMAKTSIKAYFVTGLLLITTNIMNIAILGTQYTSISTVPLLQSVQLIQIADFLERFDALVILLLYAGIFVKATLWFQAAVLGFGELFNLNYKKVILPIGAAIYVSSFLEPNWIYHIWFGKVVAYNYMVNPVFILFIPLLLFIVMLVKGTAEGGKSIGERSR
ncbi:spore gernimation protein [Brevibacillus formosus]|uniref:Spore gernimation protein n=2 Tax=Brevibacillus formosus TaxID=54913 RepID=A0A220ML82_9BACL|nr:spore gernimation protein [Brevibacillus formosus]